MKIANADALLRFFRFLRVYASPRIRHDRILDERSLLKEAKF